MDILKRAENTEKFKVIDEKYFELLKPIFNLTPQGREDNRSILLNYEDIQNEEHKKILNELIEKGKVDFKAPGTCKAKLKIGMYMRKAKTEIEKCENKSIFRVIYNLGNTEIYNFIDGADRKTMLFEKNTYMMVPLLSHKLFISSKTSNVDESSGNIVAAGLSIKKRTIIRPLNYQRITVIIDYSPPDEITDNINETLTKITTKINEANDINKSKSKRKKKKALYKALSSKDEKKKEVKSESDDEYEEEQN